MSIPKKTLSGKLYPTRKICVHYNRRLKKAVSEKRYDRQHASQPEVNYIDVADWLTGATNIGGKFQSISERPLFIKAHESSREIKKSYGSHGITAHGRRTVENVCVLLEKKYSKECLGFVTCTIPSFPQELHHKINGVWGEITRRFYQKLKRLLAKNDRPFIYVGVTEIQEKRFKKTGVPAPHLHFVYVCREKNNAPYWLYVCQIHRCWNEAVREGIAQVGYPFTMSSAVPWGNVHCKRVQKSAGAYLGKYMSKGGKVLDAMKEQGWTEFPKQWWSACMQCKKMFKDSVVRLSYEVCKKLFYGLGECLEEGLIQYASYVDILINGEFRTVALVGVLTAKGCRELTG